MGGGLNFRRDSCGGTYCGRSSGGGPPADSEARLPPAEGLVSLLGCLANRPSFSGASGDSGRGFGKVPLLSANPGPRLSTGLAENLGVVSFVPTRLKTGLPSSLPELPEVVLLAAGLGSSGYGARCTRGSAGF